MTRVILIAGDSKRFLPDTKRFYSYLTRYVGILPKEIQKIRTAYLSEITLIKKMVTAVLEKTDEPLLIVFCGHGRKNGWVMDDSRVFPYIALSHILLAGTRPIQLINDCCYAMSVTQKFKKFEVDKKRVSLIGACTANKKTSEGLCEWVIERWTHRSSAHHAFSKLIWGTNWDYCFFSAG